MSENDITVTAQALQKLQVTVKVMGRNASRGKPWGHLSKQT